MPTKTLKTLLGLLFAATVAVLAAGTVVEKLHGTDQAARSIYHTPWFFALWAGLAAAGAAYAATRRLHRRPAGALLHGALLLILLGAAVTFLTGREGRIHLREGMPETCYMPRGSHEMQPLPVALRLDRFEVTTYPGTETPADFVSRVTCTDRATGHARPAVISMNHILSTHGYRFYQTNFDTDRKGTVLTVNHDPWGTALTYAGYALLAVAMALTLLSPRGEFRRLLRSPALRRRLFGLALLAVPALAAARSVPTIQEAKAREVARYQVEYNGRVVPLNTVAIDFVQKLYGRRSYRGLRAEQVVYGWLVSPEAWKREPMIRIPYAPLRRRLGIEGKYAAMQDLFDADGKYRLMPLIQEEQRQDAMGKAIRALDEQAGLVLMLTGHTLFTPLPAGAPRLSEARVEAEIIYNRIPFATILFMLNLTMGLATFLALLWAMGRTRGPRARRAMRRLWHAGWAVLAGAFVFALAGYALRWYVGGRVPLGNGYETMLFMSLALMGLTLALRRLDYVLPFGFLLSGLTLLVSHLGQMSPQITNLMPVLQSPLLSIHVSITMAAYALLAFMALNGVLALLLTPRGGRRDATTGPNPADGPDQLTVLSRLMLYPAVFLLAAGIFLGAVWANVSWGRYWSWDPKETWALITLMVYAVPMHTASLPALRRPRAFHLYLICAFLTVLMTYFGVNYFLGGMHAYA